MSSIEHVVGGPLVKSVMEDTWEGGPLVKSVMEDTWGHTFPDKKEYTGLILVAAGYYGDFVVLDEAVGVPHSPWWYYAIEEWLSEVALDYRENAGEIWEFFVTVKVDKSKHEIIIVDRASRKIPFTFTKIGGQE